MGLPRVIAEALAAKLKADVAGLAEAYAEWPEANQSLIYPSASVTVSGDVGFERGAPYLISQGAVVSNQATNLYCIGNYQDLPVQIDIWTRYKVERDEFYEKVWNVLNPVDSCLMLQLAGYYNEWLSITQRSFQFLSTPDATTRKEWRVLVSLVASCRAVKQRSDFIITQPPVLEFDTPDTID